MHIVLDKANKYFVLSNMKKGIIKSHMFSVNIKNRFKYLESMLLL